jgi:hypothetical protein
MNSRILSGSKLIVLTSLEAVRAETFAALGIEGWQSDAVFPETIDDLDKEVSGQEERVLLAVIDPDPIKAEQLIASALNAGLQRKQIVFGCVQKSFGHRVIARNGLVTFPFDLESGPLGVNVKIGGLASALLTAWKEHISLQLDQEVKVATTHGALALLAASAGLTGPGVLKERAHITFALANHMNGDPIFRKKAIRTALYSDLVDLPSWRDIAREWRDVWPVIPILEAKESNPEESGKVWPRAWPIELALVATAKLTTRLHAEGATNIVDQVKEKSVGLPLELRTGLNLAVDTTLRKIFWSRRNAA